MKKPTQTYSHPNAWSRGQKSDGPFAVEDSLLLCRQYSAAPRCGSLYSAPQDCTVPGCTVAFHSVSLQCQAVPGCSAVPARASPEAGARTGPAAYPLAAAAGPAPGVWRAEAVRTIGGDPADSQRRHPGDGARSHCVLPRPTDVAASGGGGRSSGGAIPGPRTILGLEGQEAAALRAASIPGSWFSLDAMGMRRRAGSEGLKLSCITMCHTCRQKRDACSAASRS